MSCIFGVYKRELLGKITKRELCEILKKESRNPFRPESMYCLEYAKIYNPNAFCGSKGILRYYIKVDLFSNSNRIITKRA